MEVNISQAISLINACLGSGLVPMMKGSPGIGKSDIVHGIEQQKNLKGIDLRLSQCDPTDVNGFPQFRDGKATYIPMDTFPTEHDPLPVDEDGKEMNGWVLFLDEFNSAPIAVQAAAYKLVLDRKVGQFKLHPKVYIVCAGNRENDGAIVNETSTAMQSRLVHFQLMVSLDEWLKWAALNDVNFMITSYLQFKPDHIYTFKPDHTDETYACPRTWAFANRLMKVRSVDHEDFLPLMSGALSEGVATEFKTFCEIYKELVTIDDILKSPTTLAVPTRPDILFALTGTISHHATKENLPTLLKYILRMPPEFQIVTLKEAIRKTRDLMRVPEMIDWVSSQGRELLG